LANADDLVCKTNDLLNKKPITPEDELQDALDEMARDIALIEPNHINLGEHQLKIRYIAQRLKHH
jgi:hypothetical protein